MLSKLYEDSSSKNWCARPSRVQNRLKVLREISGVPSSRECRFHAKEPSLINGGYAFFDEIPLNFPKPQRRKQEAVPRLKLGGFVIIRYRGRRCVGRLARFSQPAFGPRRSQASPPQSSCSHQRFSVLVSPFLFTFGSSHDVTPVVTDLLRRLAFHLSKWELATAEDGLRLCR